MEKDSEYEKVLGVFAHYGFRKASMDDLARAADVSRQTLYNRFRTKEAVLDWAVEGFMGAVRERASTALADSGASTAGCLLNAFSRWSGDHVALLHDAPHGAEIMDLGLESLRRLESDPNADFEKEIARFLIERGVCETPKDAVDAAYLLLMASKGLFLKSRSSDEFEAGMTRIIAAAI